MIPHPSALTKLPAAKAGFLFMPSQRHLLDPAQRLSLPWGLAFSDERAPQAPALKAWGGKPECAKSEAARP
ncbi:MAG: hypothetical protein FJ146_11665 [Deltaproteobacteria bacterium]|nr:hypothetical protein [Deltaproteobacteria bacterium]